MATPPTDDEKVCAVLDIMKKANPTARSGDILMLQHLMAHADWVELTVPELQSGMSIAVDRGFFTRSDHAPQQIFHLTNKGFEEL